MAAPTSAKQACLLVVPASPKGVSSQSFVQVYTTLHQAQVFIQLASPEGKTCEFVNQSDTNRRWIADFRSKAYSQPIALSSVDASRYNAIVIPHTPGALDDLYKDKHLGDLLNKFSENDKHICAIGHGCAALCSARGSNNVWSFKGRSLTSMSVYELAKDEDFINMSLIVEDFMKDNGANYSVGSSDKRVHVVVDGNIITGQNEQATLIAVHNLIVQLSQNRPRAAVTSSRNSSS